MKQNSTSARCCVGNGSSEIETGHTPLSQSAVAYLGIWLMETFLPHTAASLALPCCNAGFSGAMWGSRALGVGAHLRPAARQGRAVFTLLVLVIPPTRAWSDTRSFMARSPLPVLWQHGKVLVTCTSLWEKHCALSGRYLLDLTCVVRLPIIPRVEGFVPSLSDIPPTALHAKPNEHDRIIA